MDTMTLTKEQMELKAMVPTMQSGNARVRELTPAQRRAVMFAQQQVLRVRHGLGPYWSVRMERFLERYRAKGCVLWWLLPT